MSFSAASRPSALGAEYLAIAIARRPPARQALSARAPGVAAAGARSSSDLVAARLDAALALRKPSPSAADAPAPPPITAYARQDDRRTHILGHDRYGYTVNSIRMRGSVLCFPNFTLLWSPTRVRDVSPRSLAPVHMIRPKVELVLLGTGGFGAGAREDEQRDCEDVNPALFNYLSRKGVALESMPTPAAIATFNMLANEGRAVCAALVSRAPVDRDEASLFTADAYAAATPEDRVALRALAEDVLPQDRDRLLTAGGAGAGADAGAGAGAGAGAPVLARWDSEAALEHERAAQRAREAERAAARADAAARERRADVESAALAQRFGYPGSQVHRRDPKIFVGGKGDGVSSVDGVALTEDEQAALRSKRRSWK